MSDKLIPSQVRTSNGYSNSPLPPERLTDKDEAIFKMLVELSKDVRQYRVAGDAALNKLSLIAILKPRAGSIPDFAWLKNYYCQVQAILRGEKSA